MPLVILLAACLLYDCDLLHGSSHAPLHWEIVLMHMPRSKTDGQAYTDLQVGCHKFFHTCAID